MRRSVGSLRSGAKCLCVLVILAMAVVSAASTEAKTGVTVPRRLRQAQATTTNAATVSPAGSEATPTSIDDGTHTWELVDVQPTTTPQSDEKAMVPADSDSSSSHSGSIHQAHLDFQEKMESTKPSATGSSSAVSSSSSSSASASTHHRTPMTGYVVVGAMAILCVGIAAGVAKKRNEAGGNH